MRQNQGSRSGIDFFSRNPKKARKEDTLTYRMRKIIKFPELVTELKINEIEVKKFKKICDKK
ncbi:MAG: hypothetical protein QXE93_00770 [Candidatus Pacearchaeota archaeon]